MKQLSWKLGPTLGVGPIDCVFPHGSPAGERQAAYLVIVVTRPAPTVRPPSRMAKR